MHEVTPNACAEWQALRERRRYLGVTQREVAALINVSEHRVRRLELGDIAANEKDRQAAAELVAQWAANPPERKPFRHGRPECRPTKVPLGEYESVKDKVLAHVTDTPQTVLEISKAAGICEVATRKYLKQHAAKTVISRQYKRQPRPTETDVVHYEMKVTGYYK